MTDETATPAAAPESTAPTTVTIPATSTTPAVSLSADEHKLLADLKASGHDLGVLFKDAIAKL